MGAWDDLRQLFRKMDLRNKFFENALEEIGKYLKDLSETTRVRAVDTCNDSINALLELKVIKPDLTEEDLQYFFNRKIDAADYCAPFDSFQSFLRSDVDSLCTMREYLRQQPQTETVLCQTYQTNCQSHLLSKQIDYLSLNHFVIESRLTEEETTGFRNMLDSLSTFAHIAVWEADLAMLNAKLEKTFQDYEITVSQYARTLGENFTDYLKEKKNAAEKLKMYGYDDAAFEELAKKIESDVENAGIATRLGRSQMWKDMNDKGGN